MNKKTVITLTFLFVATLGFSQKMKIQKPDYKKIEKEIAKEKSAFFYPKLMQRYLQADSTLTLKEKRNLYYGYSFQNKYAPYGNSSFNDSLRAVFEKADLAPADLNAIIRFSDSVLVKNPFDLRAINHQLYALKELDKQPEFARKLQQMQIVIDALLSSGDGLSKNTSFYVIYVAHEYDLLEILGFEFGGQQSLIGHYDYLKLAKNTHNIEGLYFDVSPCFNSMKKLLEKNQL